MSDLCPRPAADLSIADRRRNRSDSSSFSIPANAGTLAYIKAAQTAFTCARWTVGSGLRRRRMRLANDKNTVESS